MWYTILAKQRNLIKFGIMYKIKRELIIDTFKILLLDVSIDKNYQSNIKSNIIGIDKSNNIFWIAESPQTVKNDYYYDFTIYEGKIYAPTNHGLHHIIKISNGTVIGQEMIK